MKAEEKQKLMQECLQYFRERPVYEKVFQKMRGKYESLGHINLSVPKQIFGYFSGGIAECLFWEKADGEKRREAKETGRKRCLFYGSTKWV